MIKRGGLKLTLCDTGWKTLLRKQRQRCVCTLWRRKHSRFAVAVLKLPFLPALCSTASVLGKQRRQQNMGEILLKEKEQKWLSVLNLVIYSIGRKQSIWSMKHTAALFIRFPKKEWNKGFLSTFFPPVQRRKLLTNGMSGAHLGCLEFVRVVPLIEKSQWAGLEADVNATHRRRLIMKHSDELKVPAATEMQRLELQDLTYSVA